MPVSPRLLPAASAALAGVLLPGCTLIEHWLDGGATDPRVHEPSVAAPPQEDAPPVPNDAPRDAVVAKEGGCALVFTEEDATQAFTVIGGLAADCVYDGVRVEAASMEVRWKPSEDSDDFFSARIAPKGCGEGVVVGELDVAVPDETRARCPVATEALEVALRANLLPAGSYR